MRNVNQRRPPLSKIKSGGAAVRLFWGGLYDARELNEPAARRAKYTSARHTNHPRNRYIIFIVCARRVVCIQVTRR